MGDSRLNQLCELQKERGKLLTDIKLLNEMLSKSKIRLRQVDAELECMMSDNLYDE